MKKFAMILCCLLGICSAFGKDGMQLTKDGVPSTIYLYGREQQIEGGNLPAEWWWRSSMISMDLGKDAEAKGNKAEAARYFKQAESYLLYFQGRSGLKGENDLPFAAKDSVAHNMVPLAAEKYNECRKHLNK